MNGYLVLKLKQCTKPYTQAVRYYWFLTKEFKILIMAVNYNKVGSSSWRKSLMNFKKNILIQLAEVPFDLIDKYNKDELIDLYLEILNTSEKTEQSEVNNT